MDLDGLGFSTSNGAATASLTPVNAIRLFMKGGDDIVGLDATVNTDLSGAFTADLGGGNNVLSLQSFGTISLGSVSIRSGSGIDELQVGSTNTTILGNFLADLGNGANTTFIKIG